MVHSVPLNRNAVKIFLDFGAVSLAAFSALPGTGLLARNVCEYPVHGGRSILFAEGKLHEPRKQIAASMPKAGWLARRINSEGYEPPPFLSYGLGFAVYFDREPPH